MTYTIKSNRTSYHIDGIATRTKSTGQDTGSGAVPYYAESVCGSLTRGAKYGFQIGQQGEDLAEILKSAELSAAVHNMKMCSNCAKAAQEVLEQMAPAAGDALSVALGKLTSDELELIRAAIADKRI
jgi:hypothetical protein